MNLAMAGRNFEGRESPDWLYMYTETATGAVKFLIAARGDDQVCASEL